jgi:hypothetical protein
MMSGIRRPWVRPMCSEPTWFHQFGPSGFWPPPQYRSQLVHWVLGSLLIVVWFNGAESFYSNMLCFKRGSCMLLDLPKFTVLPSTRLTLANARKTWCRGWHCRCSGALATHPTHNPVAHLHIPSQHRMIQWFLKEGQLCKRSDSRAHVTRFACQIPNGR